VVAEVGSEIEQLDFQICRRPGPRKAVVVINSRIVGKRQVSQKPVSRNFGLARHLTAANFPEADFVGVSDPLPRNGRYTSSWRAVPSPDAGRLRGSNLPHAGFGPSWPTIGSRLDTSSFLDDVPPTHATPCSHQLTSQRDAHRQGAHIRLVDICAVLIPIRDVPTVRGAYPNPPH
jgi:hypothetical protein